MAESETNGFEVSETIKFWFAPESQVLVKIEEVSRVLEEVRRRLAGMEFAKTLVGTGMMIDPSGDVLHSSNFDPDDPAITEIARELDQHIDAYRRVIALCVEEYEMLTTSTI